MAFYRSDNNCAYVVYFPLDRDDRTDAEIGELRRRGVRVLSRRTIESYLLDDSVLVSMCNDFGRPDAVEQLVAAKRQALESSIAAGGAPDDHKRIAGDVYNAAKRLFPQRKLGSDKRAFMKGVCAPLIRPGSVVYAELRHDILGD